MMNLSIFIFIIFLCHWIGDFLFQTNWMAINKSHSQIALLSHIGVIFVTTFSLFLSLVITLHVIFKTTLVLWSPLILAGINAGSHYCIDFITSRLNAKFWKENKRSCFFNMIGFDQVLHLTILFVTFVYQWILIVDK